MLNDLIGLAWAIVVLSALAWLMRQAGFSIFKKTRIFLSELVGAVLFVALCSSLAAVLVRNSTSFSIPKNFFIVLIAVVMGVMTFSATAYGVALFERKQITRKGSRQGYLLLLWILLSAPWLYLLWKAA